MQLWKRHEQTLVVTIVLTTLLLWTSEQCHAQTAAPSTDPRLAPAEASWPRCVERNGHTIRQC
jgi:hypothetical protein